WTTSSATAGVRTKVRASLRMPGVYASTSCMKACSSPARRAATSADSSALTASIECRSSTGSEWFITWPGARLGPGLLRKRHGSPQPLRRAGRHRVSRAAGLVQVAQPLPEAPDLVADLLRGRAVPLAAARKAVEAHRLAPRDRCRREVAELPVLRAVDRPAHDGHVLLDRDHRCTRLHRPGNARSLPRALDE